MKTAHVTTLFFQSVHLLFWWHIVCHLQCVRSGQNLLTENLKKLNIDPHLGIAKCKDVNAEYTSWESYLLLQAPTRPWSVDRVYMDERSEILKAEIFQASLWWLGMVVVNSQLVLTSIAGKRSSSWSIAKPSIWKAIVITTLSKRRSSPIWAVALASAKTMCVPG